MWPRHKYPANASSELAGYPRQIQCSEAALSYAYAGPLLLSCPRLAHADRRRRADTVRLKLERVGIDISGGAGVRLNDG